MTTTTANHPSPSARFPRDHDGEPPRLRPTERISLVGISLMALAWISLMAYSAVRSLQQKFIDNIYSVSLPLDSGSFEIAAPTGGTADVTDVAITSAYGHISNFSNDLAVKIWINHIMSFLVMAIIASAVIYLCVRLLAGRPFARSLTVAAVTVSLTLIFLGSASDVLSEIIRNQAQLEALGATTAAEGPYSGGSGFSFPGGYLLGGLAVAAIAVAFRIGARLTQDTKGLV